MADQLISTVVHDALPESYVRPESQRPRLDEVVSGAQIPVVDLADPDPAAVVAGIGEACATHGFFQVLNHGVPAELMDAMLAAAYEFFRLPAEEKAKLYSDDPAKKMRLSTSFNVRKETVHNWRDYLRLHCHPLHKYVPDWPANPPSFREIVDAYSRGVGELGLVLNAMISESMGLDGGYIKKTLGEKEQHMTVNFYPNWPAPELTYGLPAHIDPNAFTILLMDQQVAGLQVLKEGRWIKVNPQPNALVIDIGNQLQVTRELNEPGRILSSRIAALSESNGLVIDIGGDQLQVCIDKAMGAKAGDPIAVGAKANPEETGSENGRRGERNLKAVMAIIAASSAVNGITGGDVNLAVALASFLAVLGAVILTTVSVRSAKKAEP